MTARHNGSRGRRPSANRRSRAVAVLSVLTGVTAAQIISLVQPPTAQAIICVGIGRVIGISDCFGGGYAMQNHFPPPSDYAPLPQDYAPPPPPPSTTTPAP